MAKITYDKILDALKAIATKLNATLPEKRYSNQKDAIAGTLDAISDADMGGLPAVTGDDDGKVLTVVEGEWAPAAGGGGGSFSPDITDPQDGQTLVYDATAAKWVNAGAGIMLVHNEVDENTGVVTMNKTYAEIYSALASGQLIFAFSKVVETAEAAIDALSVVSGAWEEDSVYNVETMQIFSREEDRDRIFTADSVNYYPTWSASE